MGPKPPPLPLPKDEQDPLENPELPSALSALMTQLSEEKKSRRTTTFALSLVLFVVLVLLGVIGVTQNQRNDDRVNQSRAACATGNKLREQIRAIGSANNARVDKYLDLLVVASEIAGRNNPTTKEQTEARAKALAEFRRLDTIESNKVKKIVKEIEDNNCKTLYK